METLSRRYSGDLDLARGLRAAHAANPQVEDHLDAIAMVMLSPLAVMAGRALAAQRWLEGNGFSIAFSQLVSLTADRIGRVWKYQPVPHDPIRIRLVREIMTCGPALVLIVAGVGPEPAAERLCRLKGPSNPRRLEMHQLRYALGAGNMFNNLVHASDGVAEVIREISAVLDDAQLDRAWQQVAGIDARSCQIAADTLSPGRRADHGYGASLVHWVTDIRCRLVRKFSIDRSDLDSLVQVVEAQSQWARRRDATRPLAVLDDFRSTFRPDITSSFRDADSADLAVVLHELDRVLFTSAFDLDEMLVASQRADFHLDATERAVLAAEWLSTRHERWSSTRTDRETR